MVFFSLKLQRYFIEKSCETQTLLLFETDLSDPLGFKKEFIYLNIDIELNANIVNTNEVVEIASGRSHFLLRTKDG